MIVISRIWFFAFRLVALRHRQVFRTSLLSKQSLRVVLGPSAESNTTVCIRIPIRLIVTENREDPKREPVHIYIGPQDHVVYDSVTSTIPHYNGFLPLFSWQWTSPPSCQAEDPLSRWNSRAVQFSPIAVPGRGPRIRQKSNTSNSAKMKLTIVTLVVPQIVRHIFPKAGSNCIWIDAAICRRNSSWGNRI